MGRWGHKPAMIRRSLGFARLACVVLLGLVANADALEFRPIPPEPVWSTFSETANADDPALPAGERLARLTRTVEALESVAAEIRQHNAAINSATTEGSALTNKLHEDLAQLDAAANSATVRAATGAVDQHGLGWLCNHIRGLNSEFDAQSRAIAVAVSPYESRLAAIPVGETNAAARIGALTGEINASLRARLAAKELQDFKVRVDTIASELPYAWGTYTTLSRMADETDADTRKLSDITSALDSAARLDFPFSQYLHWKDMFLAASHALQSAPGIDLPALKALYGRVSVAAPLPNGVDIKERIDVANALAAQFRKTYDGAYREVDERMRAMRREYSGGVEQRGEPEPGPEMAPNGCEGMKDALAELRDTRIKGGKLLGGGLDGLSTAASARDSAIARQIKRAANAVTLESGTLASLEQKLAQLKKDRSAATDAQRQAKLGDAIAKANVIKAASMENKARMERTVLRLSQESAAVDRLKQTIDTLTALAEATVGS